MDKEKGGKVPDVRLRLVPPDPHLIEDGPALAADGVRGRFRVGGRPIEQFAICPDHLGKQRAGAGIRLADEGFPFRQQR
jgi:hypothetical protein